MSLQNSGQKNPKENELHNAADCLKVDISRKGGKNKRDKTGMGISEI
jgi:hypothetical protein